MDIGAKGGEGKESEGESRCFQGFELFVRDYQQWDKKRLSQKEEEEG